MTKNNSFKKQIRARMKATGETYAQARHALQEKTFSLDFLMANGLSPFVNKPASEVVIEDLFSGKELQDLQKSLMRKEHVFICGGAYTGKTFTLNAILNSNAILHPTERVITIEENVNELTRREYDTSLLTDSTVSIRDMVQHALRFSPDLIAIGEIGRDEIWLTDHITQIGIGSYSTMHSGSITDLALTLDNTSFPQPTTVVMMDRFKIGEHYLFLKAVVPVTKEFSEAMSAYRKDRDEEQLHRVLAELGIVTIDAKRKKLVHLGVLK